MSAQDRPTKAISKLEQKQIVLTHLVTPDRRRQHLQRARDRRMHNQMGCDSLRHLERGEAGGRSLDEVPRSAWMLWP